MTSLDPERADLLRVTLDCLGPDLVKRAGGALGGGMVLAGRWKHRVSTEIDLFTTLSGYLSVRSKVAESLSSHPDVAFVQPGAYMVICHLKDGREFSFGGGGFATDTPISDEIEPSSGLPTITTAEILAGKIIARVVHLDRYLIRDAYDIVCCAHFDLTALTEVQKLLTPFDVKALKRSSEYVNFEFDRLKPLISPRYPKLLDIKTLKPLLFECLLDEVSSAKLAPLFVAE